MYIEALSAAHRAYGVDTAYILMVIEAQETNAWDQNHLKFGLLKKGISLMFVPSTELINVLKMDNQTGKLYYQTESTKKEISIVYLRYSCTQEHFTKESDW